MRGAVALLIAGALSARAAIGREPPADQPPAASARLVTIDLVATDARGRTVENLTAADFDLREAGAPLALESVRFVRAAPAARPAPVPVLPAADERHAAARDAAPLFALFLAAHHAKASPN